MLNFDSILLFSEDSANLAEFYKKIFAKDPEWNEGGYYGWKLGDASIAIGPHEKVTGKNPNPERILINLVTSDVKGEFLRVKELGAEVVMEPYHPAEAKEMEICTFADPDGNYFQITSPFEG